MNEDEQIANIQKKVDKEKVLLNAANAMLQQTHNDDVRSRLNNQMRDGRRNIQFFEEKIRDLQMKRLGQKVDNMSISSGSTAVNSMRPNSGGGAPAPPPKDASGWSGDRGSYSSGSIQYSQIGGHGDMMPPRHPYAPPGPTSSVPKARPNFTKLGSSAHSPITFHLSHQTSLELILPFLQT